MKKINFLVKLRKEGKMQIVEPNETLKDSYIKKSESNLLSAKILLSNNLLEESVALAYYSMYHLLSALFYRVGIKCENHAASIILLDAVFKIGNKEISFAKKERIDKQYYTDFRTTKEEVKESIKTAEDFNRELLDFISKLDSHKIKEYRENFLHLIE